MPSSKRLQEKAVEDQLFKIGLFAECFQPGDLSCIQMRIIYLERSDAVHCFPVNKYWRHRAEQ